MKTILKSARLSFRAKSLNPQVVSVGKEEACVFSVPNLVVFKFIFIGFHDLFKLLREFWDRTSHFPSDVYELLSILFLAGYDLLLQHLCKRHMTEGWRKMNKTFSVLEKNMRKSFSAKMLLNFLYLKILKARLQHLQLLQLQSISTAVRRKILKF